MGNGFSLPPKMINSIDTGCISNNISAALNRSKSFKKNNLYIKHKDLIICYIKAYLVYAICTELSFDLERESGVAIDSELNYLNMKNNLLKIESEIATLFDILESASQDDNYIKAMYLKTQFDFNNLKNLENDPGYEDLHIYDILIKKTIHNLQLDTKFKEIDEDTLLKITKCYLISENKEQDPEFFCGDSGFLEKIIVDAYSLYEQYKISYDERIESRDSDYNKVRLLKRIIDDNGFDK